MSKCFSMFWAENESTHGYIFSDGNLRLPWQFSDPKSKIGNQNSCKNKSQMITKYCNSAKKYRIMAIHTCLCSSGFSMSCIIWVHGSSTLQESEPASAVWVAILPPWRIRDTRFINMVDIIGESQSWLLWRNSEPAFAVQDFLGNKIAKWVYHRYKISQLA